MRISLTLAALATLLGCSVPVSQTPPLPTPRDAALAAFAAYDARDWARLVAVVHPAALTGFRDRMIEIARLVAAAQREEEAGRGATSPAKGESDEPSVAWLRRISAETLFVRELRRRFEYLRDRPELEPHVTYEILGEVADGDSTVYVVYRVTTRVGAYKQMKAQEGKEVELLAVRRVPGGWRPWLNQGLMAPRQAGLDLIRAVQ